MHHCLISFLLLFIPVEDGYFCCDIDLGSLNSWQPVKVSVDCSKCVFFRVHSVSIRALILYYIS